METRDRKYYTYIKAVVSTTRFDFAYVQHQSSVRYPGNLQRKKERKNKQSLDTVTSVMQSRTIADTNIEQRCVLGLQSDCRLPEERDFLQVERSRLTVTIVALKLL